MWDAVSKSKNKNKNLFKKFQSDWGCSSMVQSMFNKHKAKERKKEMLADQSIPTVHNYVP